MEPISFGMICALIFFVIYEIVIIIKVECDEFIGFIFFNCVGVFIAYLVQVISSWLYEYLTIQHLIGVGAGLFIIGVLAGIKYLLFKLCEKKPWKR